MGGFDSPTPDQTGLIMKKIIDIKMIKNRWNVEIKIIYDDYTVDEYIASADNHYTWGNGIWFGTKEEYDSFDDLL